MIYELDLEDRNRLILKYYSIRNFMLIISDKNSYKLNQNIWLIQ